VCSICTSCMCRHRLAPTNHVPSRALQAAQAELGKAAQDFRRLHSERQELLEQWEGVLKAISKRDASILEAGGWRGLPKSGSTGRGCRSSPARFCMGLSNKLGWLMCWRVGGHAGISWQVLTSHQLHLHC